MKADCWICLKTDLWGSLLSKRATQDWGMGGWEESLAVQGWAGVLFFRSQWIKDRVSAGGVKQKLARRPASGSMESLAKFTLGPQTSLLSFPGIQLQWTFGETQWHVLSPPLLATAAEIW